VVERPGVGRQHRQAIAEAENGDGSSGHGGFLPEAAGRAAGLDLLGMLGVGGGGQQARHLRGLLGGGGAGLGQGPSSLVP